MDVEIDEEVKKPGSGLMTIQVIEGKNLDPFKTGAVNAYLNFRTGYHYKRTKAIPKTINPQWNEIIKIEGNVNEVLRIRVWDQNILSKNQLIAEGFYDPKKMELFTGEVKTISLKDKTGNGEVIFKVKPPAKSKLTCRFVSDFTIRKLIESYTRSC